ncbi:hypothetical protein J2S52_004630 [Streptomyces sp. DSM 41037]|nr:hypothetical protein [Streptomyces sp. DSM 41037]
MDADASRSRALLRFRSPDALVVQLVPRCARKIRRRTL